MRARLKDADVQFVLGLLRREKALHDRKMKDMEDEILLLEVTLRKLRRMLHFEYFRVKDGYFYVKERLAYLKSKQYSYKMFQYSRALNYLTARYESMLRGKTGRPLGVTSWGRSCLKGVVKEKVFH